MQNQLFEAALGIAKPWYVRVVDFDAARKVLTIGIDFVAGSRFAAPGIEGRLPLFMGNGLPRTPGLSRTSASNSSVKPESLPNQSGSIWTTRPSGSLTRGVLTSR